MILKIPGWVKIGIDFIKTLVRQWKGRSQGNPPSEPDSGTASECLVTGPESIVIRPESQISTRQELERRREIVRQFFNDFWRSADYKPVTFAERLNRAEGYINERLAACGEAWQLDPATRKQLGLPPNLS